MNKTRKLIFACILFSILGVFFIVSSIVQFVSNNFLSAILDSIAGILFIVGVFYEVYRIKKTL
ncbi:hypothetical protein [Pseudobacteroides sp.]|uniref:hypothetical protein n=1 Tax=Pseudobacteroides sp. TaxID=1968840 RepID=UPI002F94339C